MASIMIDAGHYGKYNRSPSVPEYWESDMSWKLHLKLKAELEKYGIEVGTTRTSKETDLEVYKRGQKAKGYDMFISLHSNAVGSSANDSVDHPIIYREYADTSSETWCKNLSNSIAELMGTIQGGRTGTRTNESGGEYYGVLRGAKSVGCQKAYIIEHSFHTATAPSKWLLVDSNLDKLADMEAKAIATHLGVASKPTTKTSILCPFGGKKFKVTQAFTLGKHNGLDLVGLDSKNICSIGDGVVYMTGTHSSMGNYVKVRMTDGNNATYMHLSKILVTKGKLLLKGDVLGVEGSTGNSTGSHLHLQIQNSNAENIIYTSANSNVINVATYTGIQNKVGTYTIESEEDDMTDERVREIIKEEEEKKIVHFWKDLPDWSKQTILQMYRAGIFNGSSASDLALSQADIKALCYVARSIGVDTLPKLTDEEIKKVFG